MSCPELPKRKEDTCDQIQVLETYIYYQTFLFALFRLICLIKSSSLPFLSFLVGVASLNQSALSRPMQRKLVTLVNCQLVEEEGRVRAMRAARSLGERTVTELILQHQNPQQLSANLWAAVRARGCQFLGPGKVITESATEYVQLYLFLMQKHSLEVSSVQLKVQLLLVFNFKLRRKGKEKKINLQVNRICFLKSFFLFLPY